MKLNTSNLILKKSIKSVEMKLDLYMSTLLQYLKLRILKLSRDAVYSKIPVMEEKKELSKEDLLLQSSSDEEEIDDEDSSAEDRLQRFLD